MVIGCNPMRSKSGNIALWAFAIVLFAPFLCALDATIYNMWLGGGPPVPDPEIFRERANFFLVLSCGFLSGFVGVVRSLRRRKARDRGN